MMTRETGIVLERVGRKLEWAGFPSRFGWGKEEPEKKIVR
jgi:hypothetical protein